MARRKKLKTGRLKHYDKEPANHLSAAYAIWWCETFLKIPDGPKIGQELYLPEFICDDFKAIFDNKAGTRRAIISRGRKNGKTFEAALIVLLHLCSKRARVSTDLFSAAQSRDQAAILFNFATKMVRLSPELNAVVTVRETAKELICPGKGTKYRALSAEATTAFGLNPAVSIFDELGQNKGPRSTLFEALETASAAQPNPLTVVISTQAPTDADLLSVLIDDARAGHDPKVVLRLQTASLEIDPFCEEAIRAANPAFDDFMNQSEVRSMAEAARRMPARQAEFENLVLNRRVSADNPFVSTSTWRACNGPVGDLHGITLYGGLDLSSVADLTCFALMGRIGDTWHIKPTFWLPGEGLREKSQQDHVPYDLWASQGYLQTTPGGVVSYEWVANQMRDMFQEYNIAKVGFDRWNYRHLKPWLLQAGLSESFLENRFLEIGMGTQTQSPALRDFEQAIVEKKVHHGDHPVLNMCATCAVVESKDGSNRKLSKNKSTGRIDGMVAVACCFAVAPMMAKIDIDTMVA